MTPEVIVALIAVFVSGGALGAAGTLLGQWVIRKMGGTEPTRSLEAGDMDLLRGDVTELSKRLHSIDARLDFTEQLLGGALPLSRPPERIPEDLSVESDDASDA